MSVVPAPADAVVLLVDATPIGVHIKERCLLPATTITDVGALRCALLHEMPAVDSAAAAAGLTPAQLVLEEWDAALSPEPAARWYARLRLGASQYGANNIFLTILEKLYLVPKGTADVAIMLSKTAKWLTDGGETGIFTPMYFCVMQKPSL